jgi:hypothetical protein
METPLRGVLRKALAHLLVNHLRQVVDALVVNRTTIGLFPQVRKVVNVVPTKRLGRMTAVQKQFHALPVLLCVLRTLTLVTTLVLFPALPTRCLRLVLGPFTITLPVRVLTGRGAVRVTVMAF